MKRSRMLLLGKPKSLNTTHAKEKFGTNNMNWIKLNNATTLEEIKKTSFDKPVMLFKHSTTCSISATALNRLERSWKPEEMTGIDPYYLDLLNHRDISQTIAKTFDVVHESPQILLIKDGKCVYHNSHLGINYQELKTKIPK